MFQVFVFRLCCSLFICSFVHLFIGSFVHCSLSIVYCAFAICFCFIIRGKAQYDGGVEVTMTELSAALRGFTQESARWPQKKKLRARMHTKRKTRNTNHEANNIHKNTHNGQACTNFETRKRRTSGIAVVTRKLVKKKLML